MIPSCGHRRSCQGLRQSGGNGGRGISVDISQLDLKPRGAARRRRLQHLDPHTVKRFPWGSILNRNSVQARWLRMSCQIFPALHTTGVYLGFSAFARSVSKPMPAQREVLTSPAIMIEAL